MFGAQGTVSLLFYKMVQVISLPPERDSHHPVLNRAVSPPLSFFLDLCVISHCWVYIAVHRDTSKVDLSVPFGPHVLS